MADQIENQLHGVSPDPNILEQPFNKCRRDDLSCDRQGDPIPLGSRNTAEASSMRDSTYASLEQSIETTETVKEPKHSSRGKEIGKGIFIFNKEFDKSTLKRFDEVCELIGSLLLKHIRRTIRKAVRDDIAIQLRIIGKSDAEATAHLFVQCPREHCKAARKFFESSQVKTICEPEDQTVPRLKVCVVGIPPKQRSAHCGIDVCCSEVSVTGETTFCGVPISLVNNSPGLFNGEKRKATFGGVIKVTTLDGVSTLYGMTAGHVIQAWQSNRTDGDEEDWSDEIENDDSEDDDSEDDDSEDNDDDHDDGVLRISVEDVEAGPGAYPAPESQSFEAWDLTDGVSLGKVLNSYKLSEVVAGNKHPSLDWTLFEVKMHKPNELCTTNSIGVQERRELHVASRPPFHDGLSDPVTLISGSHGPTVGELLSIPARILIGPSTKFVNAYILELNEGRGIKTLIRTVARNASTNQAASSMRWGLRLLGGAY
jgi:hypothetical protein